eukprot:TRINITY_DN71409_c0_g1_i1.p2 TRINITY_DN71409_c0_g1~~TRINITY_DN71409_c0_g1_i1.p2  ORF type:complete len:262 (+),score=116.53 TRINITY_DN71409_c0_g1_i1:76-861(+)
MRALLTVLLAAPALGAIPDWLVKKDQEFAALFNAGNFSAVANLYNPGALLIPPTADQFLTQDKLAAFFASAHKGGLSGLSITPLHVLEESPTLVHEIGRVSSTQGTGTFYARWVKPGADWQYAVDIMAIGAHSNRSSSKAQGMVPVPSWMQQKDADWGSLFNAGNYAGVAAQYNPGAQLIPPTADQFLKQPALAAFFEGAAKSGLKDVKITPKHVFEETPGMLVHEIGVVADSAGSNPYYVRWINSGGDWQIAFDIMAIGE